MTSQYDDTVGKLERENLFSKTNQQFIEEEKQEQIQEKKAQQVEERIKEIDDILESNNFHFSDVNLGSQISMVSDQLSKKNSHEIPQEDNNQEGLDLINDLKQQMAQLKQDFDNQGEVANQKENFKSLLEQNEEEKKS